MKAYKKSYKYICEKCGKFSRIKRGYCRICGDQALRKATKNDYEKLAEELKIEQKEDLQVITKMKAMLDKQKRILQELIKNDLKYKKLLEREKSGESVEDLITKNREYYEKLKKEKKENSKIAIKCGESEEGRKMFAKMAMKMNMWARINPDVARIFQIKNELKFKMSILNGKIQKNKEEYEKLLEDKKKGEYVDDLMKQNRYSAENLKQIKIKLENAMNKLGIERNSDWKSKIKR